MKLAGRRLVIGAGGSLLVVSFLLAAAAVLPTNGGADQQVSQAGLREVTFAVRVGERISDLADRWQGMGISSLSTVAAVAGGETFSCCPLVPPPRLQASRFEGLFRPGNYTIRLPERSADESLQGYRYRNTVSLITSLLTRAANWRVRPKYGLSAYQLLVLASIVQKEASGGKGYRLVASVFFNRLAHDMELGSCPTLEYALGYHRPFLTWQDLKLDSPYNTYRHKGLPPTPIAFFSQEALSAVQHPARSDYLFFVFDWTTHKLLFARSIREHQRQVRLAEKDYARRYGLAALHWRYPGVFYQQVNP